MIISFVSLCFSFFSLFYPQFYCEQEWGFWGHRKINFMAVFTLPEEMLPLFKSQIVYLSEHAVDADKRRYAAKQEAIRHYIDLDYYTMERTLRPVQWYHAKLIFTQVQMQHGDTIKTWPSILAMKDEYPEHFLYISSQVPYRFYEFEWSEEYLDSITSESVSFSLQDTMLQHGVVPYQVPLLYRRLVKAMTDHETSLILRLAADLGHYIADAHVPLHTTSNYDGQLTDQTGLHAFWESRIPELFAEKEYDFLVGKAEYIRDLPAFMWQTVDDSYALVDSVLGIEKRLSQTYPADRQYCFEDRLQQTVRVPCPEYAALYQMEMQGMVEKRMQDAILAIGSVWYSAWVDAGQPDLQLTDWQGWTPNDNSSADSLNQAFQRGRTFGRPHPDSSN